MKPNKIFNLRLYLVIIILPCLQSCCHYYKISKTKENSADSTNIIQAGSPRYFILRAGDSAYHMNNINVGNEKNSLTGTLEELPSNHRLHLRNGRNGQMRYKKNKPEAAVLDEVHIYVEYDSSVFAGNSYVLSKDRIKKIEVLEKNKGRTRESYIMGGFGLTLATLITTFVVAFSISGGVY
jgi:hypothetical protein